MEPSLETTDQASNLRFLMEEKKKSDFLQAQQQADKNKMFIKPSNSTKIITITSGKGGVGKSSISVNLALAMVQAGKKVLLFDADLGLANINVLMGIVPKYNLYHVVKGSKTLKETIIHTPEGLDIICGASGYSILANLVDKERKLILDQFESISGYDILIVDTGAGISDSVVDFAVASDEVIIITTPEPTAITDAYGIIKSISLQSSKKEINLVINRVQTPLEAKKVSERVINICDQFLNLQVNNYGFIFDDESVSKATRKQKPFYYLFPKSKVTGCIKVLNSRILNQNTSNTSVSPSKVSKFFKNLFKVDDPLDLN